jgi:hypothetical protein
MRLWSALCIQRLAAARSPVLLEEHMIADGVYERAKPLRLAQSAIFPQN